MNATQTKLLIDAMAVSARVEGMKAQNQINIAKGEYPEFLYHDFDCLACELDGIGQSLLAAGD